MSVLEALKKVLTDNQREKIHVSKSSKKIPLCAEVSEHKPVRITGLNYGRLNKQKCPDGWLV
jgi:hypothetical protein